MKAWSHGDTDVNINWPYLYSELLKLRRYGIIANPLVLSLDPNHPGSGSGSLPLDPWLQVWIHSCPSWVQGLACFPGLLLPTWSSLSGLSFIHLDSAYICLFSCRLNSAFLSESFLLLVCYCRKYIFGLYLLGPGTELLNFLRIVVSFVYWWNNSEQGS